MMKRAMKKLFNHAGESIAETLIALLISSLALVMLAGAVSSSTGVIERSMNIMSRYYAKDATMSDPLSASGEIVMQLSTGSGIDPKSYTMPCCENDVIKVNDKSVVAYLPAYMQ